MTGYNKLFGSIIHSSIWSEDDKTRIVWITMLAMKDKDGVVGASMSGLARAANVPLEECQKAVAKLESPDPESRSLDHDGRRVAKIEGGWMVLNHDKYRNMLSDDPEAAASRERMRRMRSRQASSPPIPLLREDTNTHPNTDTDTGLRHVTDESATDRNVTPLAPPPEEGPQPPVAETGMVYPEDFERFWKNYPRIRRTGKMAVYNKWRQLQKAKKLPPLQTVLTALENQMYSQAWRKEAGRYIPAPLVWLNQGRWDDYEEAAER